MGDSHQVLRADGFSYFPRFAGPYLFLGSANNKMSLFTAVANLLLNQHRQHPKKRFHGFKDSSGLGGVLASFQGWLRVCIGKVCVWFSAG